MGQGSYVFCEADSIQEEYPQYAAVVRDLETQVIAKCDVDWAPRRCGFLAASSNQYGRTTIMPELFDNHDSVPMTHWRQNFAGHAAGHRMIIQGRGTGEIIPEDFKVAWLGLAFPNENMNISEIKWQIGDRKYGRINIEELKAYNKPAIVFEEGFIIDEETSFELYGYLTEADYQRIVMLGAAYYKQIDRVLGDCGAAITST